MLTDDEKKLISDLVNMDKSQRIEYLNSHPEFVKKLKSIFKNRSKKKEVEKRSDEELRKGILSSYAAKAFRDENNDDLRKEYYAKKDAHITYKTRLDDLVASNARRTKLGIKYSPSANKPGGYNAYVLSDSRGVQPGLHTRSEIPDLNPKKIGNDVQVGNAKYLGYRNSQELKQAAKEMVLQGLLENDNTIGNLCGINESEFFDDFKAIYGDYFKDEKTIINEEREDEGEKIADVIEGIKNLVYGFYSIKDGSRIDDRDFIHKCDNLGDIYQVNWDPEKTLKDKLGICTDQSVVTRYLLNKYHPEIKVQLYALYKGRFGHCVCTFEDNGKYYYLEHAWDKEEGLHGPFNSEAELEKYLGSIYHKHHDADNSDPVAVVKYNPDQLTESFNEIVLK